MFHGYLAYNGMLSEVRLVEEMWIIEGIALCILNLGATWM